MSDELDPLPPLGGLSQRALSAERARADVDPGMHDRVLARVVASVAIGAAATAAAATAHAAGATGAATGTATAAAAGAGATAAGLTGKTLPWIIAAFLVGGGVGAAVHAAVAPTTTAVAPSSTTAWPAVTSSAPALAPTSTASAEPGASLSAVPVTALPSAAAATATPTASARVAPAATQVPSAAGVASAGNDVGLAAERSLVDRARTALGRGQSADALAALDAHAARYPRGRLSEEREALAVDALARSGRMDLALARAARFRSAYPNSVFGGVVDAALVPR
jgi:hypothetical protein